MSSRHLLWIRSTGEGADALQNVLETQLDDLMVLAVRGAREALAVLSRDPGQYLLVVVETGDDTMEIGELVTRMTQINPAMEIIVLGQPDLSWGTLDLPRYYRPILLTPPLNQDALISCVAKLKETVEAKEDHAHLMRGMKRQVNQSRKNVETLLEILQRNGKLGTIVIRRDGFFLSYNSEAQRLTGFPADELTHIQNWAQTLLADPESATSLLEIVNRLWEEKSGKTELRLRINRRDGGCLTLHLTLIVLLNEKGLPQRMLALFFDPLDTCAMSEYRALIEDGKCRVYAYHPDNGFTRVSAAALDLINRAFSLDLEMEHILGRRIEDLPFPEDIAALWQDSLERAAEGDASVENELVPLGLPGRRIMDHASVTRIVSGDDETETVLAYVVPREDLRSENFHDVSIRVLAEKTLDSIPRPFLLLKAVRNETGSAQDFLCLKINIAARSLLGLNHAVSTPTRLADVFSNHESTRKIAEQARRVTETGRDAVFELWLQGPSSKAPSILVNFRMGKVGDGAAVFLENVTASKEEERQLRQYRHCFAHMQEAIIVTDLRGKIVDWNPASERLFGSEESRMQRRPSFNLTQDGKRTELEQFTKTVLQNGDVWKGEFEFIRPDGGRGTVSATVGLLKDDGGQPYGTVGLWHDLTDRKRLEERLTVKTLELQDKNAALNALLRHAEEERVRACEHVVSDLSQRLNDRVFQILETRQRPDMVETHARLLLKDLGIDRDLRKPDRADPVRELSEKELEVARLIRLGKTTEEIAFILEKSQDTVRLQRISIRRKLGLRRRTQNLEGFLKKMTPI
ncbi:MAG: PAS domain S-box protein [Desulfomonilaceae bacterium]|nr:PAS domain S-box protein [Desulfomonilaceae bacterium]